MTSGEVLDDLRRFVAAKGFFLSASLEAVLTRVERLAEEVNCEPYAPFFLLALLEREQRFHDAARVIAEDLPAYSGLDPYGNSSDYCDRAILLERMTVGDARELNESDLAFALIEYQQELFDREGDAGVWKDPRLRTPHLMLAHIANKYDESLAVDAREILTREQE